MLPVILAAQALSLGDGAGQRREEGADAAENCEDDHVGTFLFGVQPVFDLSMIGIWLN